MRERVTRSAVGASDFGSGALCDFGRERIVQWLDFIFHIIPLFCLSVRIELFAKKFLRVVLVLKNKLIYFYSLLI